MPRPPIKHVKHASSDAVVLDRADRKQIAQSLIARSIDKDKANRFADAANRAAFFAYELEPEMSTPGESQRWYREVLKAIDQNDATRIHHLVIESADEFEGRAELERQILHDNGSLPAAIEALRAHCKAEITHGTRRRKHTPRSPTCRQMLAQELVREWRVHFDDYPPYRDGSDTVFLDVLKNVIHLSEAIYLRGRRRSLVTNEALRGLTKRACTKDRRRVTQESQVQS